MIIFDSEYLRFFEKVNGADFIETSLVVFSEVDISENGKRMRFIGITGIPIAFFASR